jgi:tRNA G10  N-methylase Trm11
LLHHSVYGTDLSEKMIRYSRDNLNWLQDQHSMKIDWYLHEGDATTTTWQQPIDIIAAETYLGQPFSAPPSPSKLAEVRGNCEHIIGEFLNNIGKQIKPGTELCIAVPAWRGTDGQFTHLPLTRSLSKFGFESIPLTTVLPLDLLYFREDQVVARELLVIRKK